MSRTAQALAASAEAFRPALLAWYDRNRRDLPWRTEPTAYKTVVSEFMLQQTQVKTVLPYFARWLENFPDFKALAAADESLVLKAWEGLGYYARARNLHKLAKAVSALPAVPETTAAWLELPGVGPYTAAAVTSIAFKARAACVDGNVVRILARLTANDTRFRDSATAAKAFTEIAGALLSPKRPGDFNQAMMELGATVCTKANPSCLLCPVRKFCASGEPTAAARLPIFEPKTIEQRSVSRLWCVHGDALLVHQIPGTSRRLANLFELPEAALLPAAAAHCTDATVVAKKTRAITRYRITETIYRVPASLAKTPPDTLQWVAFSEIPSLTFSGPHRRWVAELLAD